MTPAAVQNLRLALAAILRELDGLPPFSHERRLLHGEAELLRGMLARAQGRAA